MSGSPDTAGAKTFVPELLVLTKKAVLKTKSLIEEEGNDSLMLRIFITGGGCSGFQYGFSLDDKLSDDDTIIESGSIKVVADPMSLQYLAGSEVDYEQGLSGSRFVVNNPNAISTCGCGASFSV